MNNENRPKVGVGVLILKEGEVLLGKRKGSHGSGEYAFPGGHLEYMESFEECARRETKEECGIEIKNIRFQFVANVSLYAPKHYVHISLVADWEEGDPTVLEPEKCDSWEWYALNELPTPVFKLAELSIENISTQIKYIPLE